MKESILENLELLINERPKIKSEETEIDNGWEMVSSDINNFENLYILNIGNKWSSFKPILNLFNLYKIYNNLELYIKYYCNYLGDTLYIESLNCEEIFLKSFIYAYTLDEGSKDKSFYAMLNDILRSGNHKIINQFLDIFAKLLELIKNEGFISYKGKVYRATFFNNDLLKQIKVGKIMINKALWSSTKEEKIAKKFKKNYNHKNVIIHTSLKGIYNIDIDAEKLSQFPEEKEVLILPFCKFKVKFFGKIYDSDIGDYYKLELELLEGCNILEHVKTKSIKMQDLFEHKLY